MSTPTTGEPAGDPVADASTDLVELRVPADPAYLTVVRTASAGWPRGWT